MTLIVVQYLNVPAVLNYWKIKARYHDNWTLYNTEKRSTLNLYLQELYFPERYE